MNEQMKQDIRMRGFASRSTVETAYEWIDAHVEPLASEIVGLNDAHGRPLAGEVVSPCDVPSFERSAMDGYALLGAETNGASDYNPLVFKIVGEAPVRGVVDTTDLETLGTLECAPCD